MKKKTNKFRFLFCLIYFVTVIFGSLPFGSFKMTTSLASASSASSSESVYNYYYDQLSDTAKKIYRTLEQMRDSGKLATGTYTVDLIEEGILSNTYYNIDEITAEFGAARDAFKLDNAGLFYVDFDKMSIRVLENGSNYKVTLGIGRYDNYFADGFDENNVSAAISAFNTKVEAIVNSVSDEDDYKTQIETAYKAVMNSATYALENSVQNTNNMNYLRNAYGVLVAGEGCCEAFARAFKVVLDELGVQSVLVQGVYIDVKNENSAESHKWNYVMMDDNRWYLCDPTMDNALDEETGTSTAYFVKSTIDSITIDDNPYLVSELYEANGIISTSNYEFTYPVLTSVTYEEYSTAFTFVLSESGTYCNISYNGMGIDAAASKEYYIIFTFDTDSDTPTWYYVKLYLQIFVKNNSNYSFSDYDTSTYFKGSFVGNYESCFAVTTDEPSGISEDTANYDDAKYTGENVSDKSAVCLGLGAKNTSPYATSVSPDSIRFYVGKTYNVTITFNEDLMKSNDEITPTLVLTLNGTDYTSSSYFSNFVWDANSPNKISFTFTPSKDYSYDRCFYYFSVTNLVGKTSKLAPIATGLYAMNKPSFSCPANPLSYCSVYASQPQLISNSDLSMDGWTYDDENSTPVSSSISAKLSLVATQYSESENAEAVSKIENSFTDVNILSSETYDLSLNLCDVQLKYLNGERVQILVPFPEGYTSESTGVSFKAYHFKDNGEVEEIDCMVCEYGIIMFCESFSPYTICAVEGESLTKTIAIVSEGNGSITNDANSQSYVVLSEGGSATFTITPDDGYCISSIKIGNSYVEISDYSSETLTFNYSDLSSDETVVVQFASKEVVDAEIASGYTLAIFAPESNSSLLWIVWVCLALVAVIVVAVVIVIFVKKKKYS